MSELALDYHEWNALVGHLDGVRVSELVWSEPAADSGERSGSSQLFASG